MKIRGQHQSHGQPHRDEPKKRGSRLAGDAKPEDGVERERKNEQAQSDKPPFFADVSGDEVIVTEGKKTVLLPASSEADAEYLTGAEGNQGLAELIAHL